MNGQQLQNKKAILIDGLFHNMKIYLLLFIKAHRFSGGL